MFGFIKYENLLLGAFLFSLFAVMYCAVIYIKVKNIDENLVKLNKNLKIVLNQSLDIKDQLKDIDIKE